MIWGERGGERMGGEEDLRREEVDRAIRRQRDWKATGGDGIPSEAW